MKKKLLSLVSAAILSTVVLAGCGSQSGSAGAELKTGLGTSVSIADSKDATAEGDGTAQADATIAAVTVDGSGKITQCVIDIAQTRIGVSAEGQITSDLDAEYPSKRELGDGYGMKKASAIGKEWYEQADAFAAWAVGKTASDLSGMAISEGYAGDADLAASVSIHVTGFQSAVLEAVNNATDQGAHEGDKLGLGVSTKISNSVDASAEGDGTAEAYTTISALTVGKDGKVTSSIIDAVQAKITFDTTGAITADTSADVKSKNELGDAYGMKKASAIGKEWNEQAAAYAAYTVGKTADEIAGTAMTEGRAADADLAASVSVHITDFNAVIAKAIAAAK
ncbi:MAG: hypothetical protein K6C96_09260 [Butyrivibrio sp.]|nr:hypothetical protein [Butyrivibrio sp.]